MFIFRMSVLAIFTATFSCMTCAAISSSGTITFTNSKLTNEKIVIDGTAMFDGSLIGNAIINGSLDSHDSTIVGDLTVNGDFNSVNTTLNAATINGGFNCNTCLFNSTLNITSDTIYLTNTKTKNITIHVQASGFFGTKKSSNIYLSNTIISGDITFIGGEGNIYLDKSSVINGKFINGHVVQN